MQTLHRTPAECLLQRLLQSERIESDYQISIEKSDCYTLLIIDQVFCRVKPALEWLSATGENPNATNNAAGYV